MATTSASAKRSPRLAASRALVEAVSRSPDGDLRLRDCEHEVSPARRVARLRSSNRPRGRTSRSRARPRLEQQPQPQPKGRAHRDCAAASAATRMIGGCSCSRYSLSRPMKYAARASRSRSAPASAPDRSARDSARCAEAQARRLKSSRPHSRSVMPVSDRSLATRPVRRVAILGDRKKKGAGLLLLTRAAGLA